MQVVDIAYSIAATGLPVFPCSKTKRPAIAKDAGGNGFHDATTDRIHIDQLFQRAPHAALVGVPTGEISGFDALDIDYIHGGAEWEQANLSRLPETRIHSTQSGGRHYLFRHAPGVRNSASKKTLAAGIDVRGDGGYIVAPPSAGYRVIHDAEIADWPDWLLTLVLARPVDKERSSAPTYPAEALSSKRMEGLRRSILSRVSGAGDGQKHYALRNAAISMGGILHAAGISESEAISALLGALPDGVKDWQTAKSTAEWGIREGLKRPLELADRDGYRPAREPEGAPPADDAPLPDEGDCGGAKIIEFATRAARLDWSNKLARSRSDPPAVLPTVGNAMMILANDPELVGALAYNSFTGAPLLMRAVPVGEDDPLLPGPYPRVWEGSDATLVHAYIQRRWCSRIGRETIENAMAAEAALRQFHPVRDWLAGLVWDGTPRIDTWLVTAFGAADTPFHQAVGAKVLIAAVRRIIRPGCKFDQMMVLEGPQGIGKSRALRALFGDDWFSDAIPADLTSKDAAMALLGVWGLEFAEIEHLIRTEVETIKAFLSRSVDRYRPPYGRNYVERPRQGIAIGTTNADDYLRDVTGNRRIWPIKCLKAEPEWVGEMRDQLWAEATIREAEGEPIWLDEEGTQIAAEEAASDRMSEDVWQSAIISWLTGRTQVSCADVLEHALKMPTEKMTKAADMRATAVLRTLGWLRTLARVNGKPSRIWRHPSSKEMGIDM
jgi:putative DNA primase/helicase